MLFFLRRVIPHAGYGASGDFPQIQAGDAAIGTETPAVFFKEFWCDGTMMVGHAKPPLDCQIVEAEYVRALQAEQKEHFRCPHADSSQGGQSFDGVLIGHVGDLFQIKLAALYFSGEVADVFHLAKGDAEGLQFFGVQRQNVFSVYFLETVPEALPDGGKSLGGNLLSDNLMYDRLKEIGVHFALDMADLFDDSAENLVFLFQIIEFRIAIFKIQSRFLLCLKSVCFHHNIIGVGRLLKIRWLSAAR